MNVMGLRNSASLAAEPDIHDWMNRAALNPARVPPGHPPSTALDQAQAALQKYTPTGLTRLAALSS